MEKLLKLSEKLNAAFPDQTTEIGVVYRSQNGEVNKRYTIYVQYEYSFNEIKTFGMLNAIVEQLISERRDNESQN